MTRGNPWWPLALLALLFPLSAQAVEPGEVVITEVLIDAPSADEWFELVNTTGGSLSLDGCVIAEGATGVENDHTITALDIPAGGRAVLGKGSECVAWDDGGACLVPTDYSYSTLSFNNGEPEVLTLTCGGSLIDEVTYDWTTFDADCPDGTVCSVNLKADAEDAASNDDWEGQFCVAPVETLFYTQTTDSLLPSQGTPGSAGQCPVTGTLCGAGDVTFTEMMIAPPSTSSTKEWLELYGTGNGCELQGCQLLEGPDSQPPASPDDAWDVEIMDADGGSLTVSSGQHLLFAKSADWVVGDGTLPEDRPADYRYTGISLGNDDVGFIHLVCDGTTVDSAPVNWPEWEEGCPSGGCSANLGPAAYDPDANDSTAAWCVPPSDSVYLNAEGDPIVATPGETGICTTYAWPSPGEFVFTEVMVAPASTPEWFELWSTADESRELTLCGVRKYRKDQAGEIDSDTVDEYVIGEDGRTLALAPGEVRVFSEGECLLGTEGGGDDDSASGDDDSLPAEDEGAPSCENGEFVYSSVSFTNSEEEFLALVCPDGQGGETVVDEVSYDPTADGIREAHSMMFEPGEDPSVANDDREDWCEAAFSQCFLEAGEGECNYGTPGELGECLTDDQDWPEGGPGCRCDSAPSHPWNASGFLLILLGLGRVRRKA